MSDFLCPLCGSYHPSLTSCPPPPRPNLQVYPIPPEKLFTASDIAKARDEGRREGRERIKQLTDGLRRIAALDYTTSAINGAACNAVHIADALLAEPPKLEGWPT